MYGNPDRSLLEVILMLLYKLNRTFQRLAQFQRNGFTLIELMVTIAIGTILMLTAVPSFVAFQRNAQLSDAVSGFVGAANAARANAMKQGINTYLVPATGTAWSTGWMVYADTNWNGVYNADVDSVIFTREAPSADVTIVSNLAGQSLMFNGSGYPRVVGGSFNIGTMTMSNITPRSISITIDAAGRIRSCKTGDTGC